MKSYALLCLLLPLSALATDERLPYACDNGSNINIAFSTTSDGRPQAILHFADVAITLPQVPAASGALYRADDIRLHTKGDEAVFEDGKGNIRRCKQGSALPVTAAVTKPAISSFLDISGRVFYFSRIALPPDAILVVRVQDVSRARTPARTLAEQQIELAGQQVPIAFQTTVDRDLIGKKARLTVNARIEHRGKILFASDKPHPALNKGQPIQVDMQLQKVASAQPR
ncbi:MAG TPA: YbaY family lipoprotein [Azonexus sp.]|nr:YbaY family lipoprotein [Azonexus sp.]